MEDMLDTWEAPAPILRSEVSRHVSSAFQHFLFYCINQIGNYRHLENRWWVSMKVNVFLLRDFLILC